MPESSAPAAAGVLRFLRHAATGPNLAGLRCGGDLDVPLADAGRVQAARVARIVATLEPPVGLIVTSALRRTRETAGLVAAALPGVPLLVEPGFAERALGAWNLRPAAQTQPWLDAGQTPPGGESEETFVIRVAQALQRLKPHLARRPLIIGSRGVARVLGGLLGLPRRLDVGPAEMTEFTIVRPE